MQKEIEKRINDTTLSTFDNVILELMKVNPDFAKGVETILNGGSFEDAMTKTFSEDDIEKVLSENFGSITQEDLSETLDDFQTRQLAKDIKEDVSNKLNEAELKLKATTLTENI